MWLFLLIYKDKYKLKIEPGQLYELARDVAKSEPKVKDKMVKIVGKIIKLNSKEF